MTKQSSTVVHTRLDQLGLSVEVGGEVDGRLFFHQERYPVTVNRTRHLGYPTGHKSIGSFNLWQVVTWIWGQHMRSDVHDVPIPHPPSRGLREPILQCQSPWGVLTNAAKQPFRWVVGRANGCATLGVVAHHCFLESFLTNIH